MLANTLLVILLLLIMAVWGHYGMFSALLHLLATITAGALALALWEPLVLGLLTKVSGLTEYAWGVGLLGPFVVLLILARLAFDKLVRADVEFPQIADLIGGGFFGLVSGTLTLGLAVIGLGFLPLGTEIAGYKPLVVDGRGQVERNDRLLIPVDQWAATFFARLSGGSFYSGHPLAEQMPDLARRAELFRLHPDMNATVTANPDLVDLGSYWTHPLPLADVHPIIDHTLTSSDTSLDQMVMIETIVSDSQDTYVWPPFDTDRRLRLAPTQVRLLTRRQPGGTQVHAPRALVFVDARGVRQFVPVDSGGVLAESTPAGKQIVGWVFLLPEGRDPQFLLFRQLRLPMPPLSEARTEARVVTNALGTPKAVLDAEAKARADAKAAAAAVGLGTGDGPVSLAPPVGGVKTGSQPERIRLTNELPSMINSNKSARLEIHNQMIYSGRDTVRSPTSRTPKNFQVRRIYVHPDQACIRLKLDTETVYSTLGRARALAAKVHSMFLTDDVNQPHAPIGYVWRKGNGDQEINIPKQQRISSAVQLPTDAMSEGDALYLYFAIGRNVSIISYTLGPRSWDLTPPINLRTNP